METIVTREGVMAARIAEDFCASYVGKGGFYLGLCGFADEFVFLSQVHHERGRDAVRFVEIVRGRFIAGGREFRHAAAKKIIVTVFGERSVMSVP
jgi:hypothetical protein